MGAALQHCLEEPSSLGAWTNKKNFSENMLFAVIVAVKVAVRINVVAVEGLKVAVVLSGSGSKGVPGPGNPAQNNT